MWRSVSGFSFSGFQVFSGKLQMWKDSQVIFWCRMQVGNSTLKVSSGHFIFVRFWFHPWREAPESPLNAEFGSVTSAVGSWKVPSFSLCIHCIHENAQSPVCFTTTVISQGSSLETSMSSKPPFNSVYKGYEPQSTPLWHAPCRFYYSRPTVLCLLQATAG